MGGGFGTNEQQIIDGITGGRTLAEIYDLISHIHRRHLHKELRIHNASDLSLTVFGNLFGADNPFFDLDTPTMASTLIQEFFAGQDLDFNAGHDQGTTIPTNNSIYGQAGGWQLNLSAPDFPPMLEGIHSHQRFANPPIIITFTQYLATLGIN